MTKLLMGIGAVCVAVVVGVYAEAILTANDTRFGDPGDTVQVASGKKIYAETCAQCHGANLEGQPNWRVPLPEGGVPAPPHDASGHTWHHDDELLFNYTKKGGKALVPSGFKSNMPGFGGTLSDREIWAVLAFIKSSWPAKLRDRQETLNNR